MKERGSDIMPRITQVPVTKIHDTWLFKFTRWLVGAITGLIMAVKNLLLEFSAIVCGTIYVVF